MLRGEILTYNLHRWGYSYLLIELDSMDAKGLGAFLCMRVVFDSSRIGLLQPCARMTIVVTVFTLIMFTLVVLDIV